MNWSVYIVLCSDDTLYTGITTDINRRIRQHAEGRGAKYFRGRHPREVVYLEGGHDRSSAGKRELFIKALNRSEKQLLILSKLDVARGDGAGTRGEVRTDLHAID